MGSEECDSLKLTRDFSVVDNILTTHLYLPTWCLLKIPNHYIPLVVHWVTHKQQPIRHGCHKLWTREASTRERGGPEYNKFITSLVIQSPYKRMWVFSHKRTQPTTHEDKFCGFIHYIVQYAMFIVTYISLWTLNFMIAIYLQMRALNLLVNMYYLALVPFFKKW
jgi:hypothetical protein